MRIFLSVIAASTLFAHTASAQDYYAQAFGGFSSISDLSFDGNVTTPAGTGPQSVATQLDNGFNLGIAVGKRLPSFGNLRGEVELSFASSDVGGVNFSGNGPAAEGNVSGDISTTRVFGNLLYDFKTQGKFTPYVGAGLGVAVTDLDVVYGAGGVNLSDNSTDLSAQLIVGTSYSLSDRLSLTADVRYIRDFGVESARFNGAGGLTGFVEEDIDNVNVNIGLRYNF